MKRYFVVAALAFVFQSCTTPSLELKNELLVNRKDATVIVSRENVKKIVGEIPNDKIPVVLGANGKYIPSQVDDLNRDGEWDELAFVCDFDLNETKSLNVKLVSRDEMPEFVQRTNVRLGEGNKEDGFKGVDQAVSPKGYTGVPFKYQAESVSWENDIMGFRNYFDCRNAKDLFGKLNSDMVMDKIGTKESGSYHDLSDWGMDVLHVGPSLGAGGLAMFHKDSLYRLGSVDRFEFQVVSRGPVRSVFDLKLSGWNVDGKVLNATERISIWAGKYWFQSDVSIEGIEGEAELTIGIVTSYLKEEKPFEFVANKTYTGVATHDKQSMNDDFLGLGILVKSAEKIRTGDAPLLPEAVVKGSRWNQPVGETHFVTQKVSNKKVATHYFFAAWEKENASWAKKDNFKKLMKEQAEELSSPIVVKIK
jgi:hypothetical protein